MCSLAKQFNHTLELIANLIEIYWFVIEILLDEEGSVKG